MAERAEDAWRREFIGESPSPTKEHKTASRAWLNYYISTELFDRTLPGCWSRRDPEVWLPAPELMALSRVNAEKERRLAMAKCSDIDLDVVEKDRLRVMGLTHSQAVEELVAMGPEEEP